MHQAFGEPARKVPFLPTEGQQALNFVLNYICKLGRILKSMQSEMQVRLKSHVTHSQPSRISAGLPRHIAFVYEKNDATLVSPTRGEGWTEHRRSDHFESTRAAEDKSGEGGKEECCWLNGQPKRRGKSSQQMRFLTGQGFDDT